MSVSDAVADDAELLASLPLLALLGPDLRGLVVDSFVPVSYPFGATIVAEDEDADALYIIMSGRARVLTTDARGEELSLNVLGAGDSFGETGMLRGGRRTATVRASSRVEARRLDAGVFRALTARVPELRESFELAMRTQSLGDLLRRSSPFARLPADGMSDLLRSIEPVSVAAGSVVVREGEAAGALHIVEDGRLRAFCTDSDGERDVAFHRAGDVFGERALLTATAIPATVVALTDCHLLRLDRERFERLLADHPSFRVQISARVDQLDYRETARVPLDFADELLPADASPEPADPPEDAGPLFAKRPGRIRRFAHVRQVDEADCGVAALAMVCRHFGVRVSLTRVRQLVGTAVDGTSLRGIAHGAEQLGLRARALKVSRRNLDKLALPAIIHWRGNHWVVLVDVDGDRARIADPASGVRRIPRADLDEHWSGYAVAFAPTDDLVDVGPSVSGFAWLRPFLRRHWRPIAGATALAMLVSALQLVLPVFTQITVDRVLGRRDVELLHVLIAVMAAVVVVSVVASYFQRFVLSRAAVTLDGETLDFVAAKMLALPMRYFYARRTGDLQRRLIGMRQVRQFLVQNAVLAITSATQLVVATVLMFVYSRVLALVFLALVPVYVALMRFAVRRMRPLADSLEESFSQYHSLQVDAVKGIETVKAIGAEDALRRSMLREYAGLSNRQFRADLAGMVYEGAVQVVMFLSLIAFLWVGALQVLDGSLTIGGFVSFSALLALANTPIIMLLRLWDDLQIASVLLARLSDIFEEEPEQGEDHSHLRPVPTVEGRVGFQAVCFRYGVDAPEILTDLTFEVNPGTTVAIVGRSGSGKTTLVKCLAGLIEPTAGRIMVDGIDTQTLDLRQLRQQIGFVLQENFLFSDTIAANIAFGEESPDMARVERAAQVANAHEFVVRLPLGYHTRVGETGLLLSGGQRQRIAIARAVYHEPPILVFDEATSSLDSESERAVQENMERLLARRTSFVIAHRLSTIRNADVILVLERGRIVEQGTHEELIGARGMYFYLCSQQLEL